MGFGLTVNGHWIKRGLWFQSLYVASKTVDMEGPRWHLKAVHILKLRTSVEAFKDEWDLWIVQKSQGPPDIFKLRVVEGYFMSDKCCNHEHGFYLRWSLRISLPDFETEWGLLNISSLWVAQGYFQTENDWQILHAQENLPNATSTARCFLSRIWAEGESGQILNHLP